MNIQKQRTTKMEILKAKSIFSKKFEFEEKSQKAGEENENFMLPSDYDDSLNYRSRNFRKRSKKKVRNME